MLIVSLALPSFFSVTFWATAQGVPLQLYQVQTIYTGELGVKSPIGMAFMPDEQAFFVWGENQDSVTITLPGDLGSPVNIADTIEDPLGLAFDQHSDSLFFLKAEGAELVKIQSEEISLPESSRQAATRFNVKAFDLESAQGITFDPYTGRLFILDAGKSQILIVSPHPIMGFDGESAIGNGRLHRVNLTPVTRSALHGIAFNPNNGNLYIGSPDEKKIYELTERGRVISVFDTSSFLLKNPATMLFAPSSDQTDDPLEMSLYLMDSGDIVAEQSQAPHTPQYTKLVQYQTTTGESAGQIMELSLVEPLALPAGTTLLPTTLVDTHTSNAV
jgi:uncharacterized protein YjiK